MANPGVRLYRVVPGANSLAPLITRFCRNGPGTITSFEDGSLVALKQSVGESEDIEIIPFGSLVKRILDASGESTGYLATNDQRISSLGQAASALDEDSSLRRSMAFLGNRQSVSEVLNELDAWEIEPNTIREMEGISVGLRHKLFELSTLRRVSSDLLARLSRELAADQLRRCFDTYLDPEVILPRLLVTIGAEASPARVRWLKWIGDQGCDLTVIAPRHALRTDMFEDANALAQELGCVEEWVGSGNLLSNNLFAATETRAVAPKISILAASSAMSECEWALQSLGEESEGSSAIFVRDSETYAPLLEVAADAMGLQLRIQRRINLLENAFARLTLQCIEACAQDDVRRFLPLLKRSYLTLPKAERRLLEQTISESRKVPATQWETLRAGAKPIDWFAKILDWRLEGRGESHSFLAWISKLRDLVDLIPWHDAIQQPAQYDGRRDERAFNVMQTSLSTVAQLEATERRPPDSLMQFAQKCRKIWKNADVSIPSFDDGIPVLNSVWAIPPVDTLLVLGMVEGVFPRRRREDPILSDAERREISLLQPNSRPLKTSLDMAKEDREGFYALCASGSKDLLFSYPTVGDERDSVPSFYLQRVRAAVDKVEVVERLGSPFDKPKGIDKLVESAAVESPTLPFNGEWVARARQLPIAPRALRDALVCPFQFQMRHTLKLRPNAQRTAWYNLLFLPEAANLLGAQDPISALNQLETALKRELDHLSPELTEWELTLLKGGGERLMNEWLKREFDSRSIWPRTSQAFGEVARGNSGIRTEMPGGVHLKTNIAGLTHLNSISKVIHLFEFVAPESSELSEPDQLYFGLYFLAAFESGFESALEIDGLDGARTLLLFDRGPLPNLISRNESKLKVIDLSGKLAPRDAKREFDTKTKKNLRRSIEIVEQGEISPNPGDHCRRCDYGELCRHSILFSDDEFSRFGGL
jgi:hypothetical protein